MPNFPYAQVRVAALSRAEALAQSEMPNVRANLTRINAAALQQWASTWAAVHPSGYGGFNWRALYRSYCSRSDSALDLAVWSDQVLCGLAIATLSTRMTRLTLRYMEGKVPGPHPLQRRITGIVMITAEYYARGLGVGVLEIKDPAPGLVGRYREHGFSLAEDRSGVRYLLKPLP